VRCARAALVIVVDALFDGLITWDPKTSPQRGMGRDDWGAVVAAHVGPAAPGLRR
jgi:hypothetical protein